MIEQYTSVVCGESMDMTAEGICNAVIASLFVC